MEQVHAVVLAAGKGKRMRSDLPKVLHPVCGQPLILYVLDALHHAGISSSIVVVGHGADRVREAVGAQARYVEQAEPRGTGHAVLMALPHLPDDENPVLVLYGDTPLLTAETIHALTALHRTSGSAATLLSARGAAPRASTPSRPTCMQVCRWDRTRSSTRSRTWRGPPRWGHAAPSGRRPGWSTPRWATASRSWPRQWSGGRSAKGRRWGPTAACARGRA